MARPLGRISPRKLAAALAALAIMALALALAAAPAQARASELTACDVMADAGDVEYEYYDAEIGQWVKLPDNYEEVTQDTHSLRGYTWYVVSSDVAFKGNIGVGKNTCLVLCGGTTFDVQRGIEVPEDSSLSVFAGRPAGSSGGTAGGTLRATGANGHPGIGGVFDHEGNPLSVGAVTVYGGTVIAQGGSQAAGIGAPRGNDDNSGNGGKGGPVTVYGGTVYAQGGDQAAGIGGGGHGNGGTVAVYGGTVRAQGGAGGAGIGGGGGNGGDGGPVTVYGGTVYAQGGDSAAGIGGGSEGDGGDVAIYGGAVTGIGDSENVDMGIGRGAGGRSDGGLALGAGVEMYGEYKLGETWFSLYNSYDGSIDRLRIMSTEGGRELIATFHANGHGPDPQAQTVPYLGKFAPPDPVPSAQGYAFKGWFADEGCTAPFDFEALAEADVDVWAKWAPELVFGAPSVSKTYGDAGFANPLTKPAGVQVSYASSDPGVAAVGPDGVVAIKGAGECVVTASFAGAPGLSAASASYTLTVAKKAIAIPKARAGLVYGGNAQTGVAAGAGYAVKGGSATNAGEYTATLTADKNHRFADGKATATVKWSIAKKAISVPAAKAGLVYSGREQTGMAAGTGYTVKSGGSAAGAGSYTATLTADANHAFPGGKSTATVKWSIAKAANPLKLAKATRTAKATTATKTVLGAKIKKKGQGKVTYAKVKVNKKKYKDNFIVSKKTGKITVRKGTPKGTYKVTVQAVAKGNANYKQSAAKKAVVTIKVK